MKDAQKHCPSCEKSTKQSAQQLMIKLYRGKRKVIVYTCKVCGHRTISRKMKR